MIDSRRILGMRVDATSYADATERIVRWAAEERSAYVCVANVHMTMEAHDDPAFLEVVNGADLVTPDGMPLAWGLRLLGIPKQPRVRGPDLVPIVAEAATRASIPIALYGSSPETLEAFSAALQTRLPELEIACAISPPFRPLEPTEDEAFVHRINESGARIVFVGLGCPKQERWMAARKGQIAGVMLGVGAAFDFHAGRISEAPRWMQAIGMEWLFRLLSEPRRLWRRYAYHNPRFIWLFAKQLFDRRQRSSER